MKRVYIFGRGKGSAFVKRCLKDDVRIIGYIDNYTKETSTEEGIPVLSQKEIGNDYDFIIISLFLYKDIKTDLISSNVPENKIICFFNNTDAENNDFYKALDWTKWKTELMWKYEREVTEPFTYNVRYEIYSEEYSKKGIIPRIVPIDDTINRIINEKKSLARFGDGEFEMICMRNRPRFQTVDGMLATRLAEVLKSDVSNLLIGIANNYGRLDQYTDYSAAAIRQYLSPSVRMEHMSLLDISRDYYDAYLSRPYFMYRDKTGAKTRFEHLKRIWEGQEVLIIEGEHTRSGVGNDLLDSARDVKRILAPDKNAFSKYDTILEKAIEYGTNKLILISLGPTATVLSYDLAKIGCWAVDIGQVDIEYEWFLRGATERCDVPWKTVSEYIEKDYFERIDYKNEEKYKMDIITVIK